MQVVKIYVRLALQTTKGLERVILGGLQGPSEFSLIFLLLETLV